MTFPIIQFKATNTEMDDVLQDLTDRKLRSLEKFIQDNETDLKCEVEFEKVTAQQSGDVHRVEVNLFKEGKLYRAESTQDSFEKAVDEVRDELDKEMRRAHKKETTMLKQGGRAIKDMLRFGK